MTWQRGATENPRRDCGRCHTCGQALSLRLAETYEGFEEYCPRCRQVREYASHGLPWTRDECPDWRAKDHVSRQIPKGPRVPGGL